MKPASITTAAVALVKQLRAEWSLTKPLVLAEGSDAGAAWINPGIHATQAGEIRILTTFDSEYSKDISIAVPVIRSQSFDPNSCGKLCASMHD